VDLDGAPRIASRQAGDGRRLAVDGALDSSFDEDENPLDVGPQSVIAFLCRGVAPAEFADGLAGALNSNGNCSACAR
jgi:hypothetical protein